MRRLRGGLGPACRLAVAALICGLVLAATPAVALAAGTSYTGAGTTGGTGVGLPGSVVTTCDQTGAGNTCTAQIGNCTVTITIPAGDLPSGSQLVITSIIDATPLGYVLIVEFGVGAFNNGTKITTAFVEPLTATVSCPAVTAATREFQVSSGGFTAVPSTLASTTDTFSVPSDPVYQVDNPGATTAASTTSGSGTTPAFTGANLIPEIVAGSVLVLVGGALLVGSRRLTRSRQASRAEH